jgi:hypothetical protein
MDSISVHNVTTQNKKEIRKAKNRNIHRQHPDR